MSSAYEIFDSSFIRALAAEHNGLVNYDASGSGVIPATILELTWYTQTNLWYAKIEITEASANGEFAAGEHLTVDANFLRGRTWVS